MVHQWTTTMVGKLLVAMVVLSLVTGAVNGQLRSDFYAQSCPNVEALAKAAFLNRVNFFNILALPANILRLAFHDCAVEGCQGSVLLDSDPNAPDGPITDEKLSSKNIGIGNIPVITYMKQQIDQQCHDTSGAPVVSCADVLALAGREAFVFAQGLGNLGSQTLPINLGRRDATAARTENADQQLLGPETSVDVLLSNFARFGLSTELAVALIGSHTIGIAHCVNIVGRLYPLDSTLITDLPLAGKLTALCPQNFYSPLTVVNNDQTNTVFDSQYFANVLSGQGLLTIDDNLRLDSRTRGYVQQFALNQPYFYQKFTEAYILLTSWRVLTGSEGEIRTDCTKVN